jgi:hypothetical protein
VGELTEQLCLLFGGERSGEAFCSPDIVKQIGFGKERGKIGK